MRRKRLLRAVIGATLMLILAVVLPLGSACAPKEEVYKIGVTQIVTHPSLDLIRQGFMKSMAEEGFVEGENIEYDYLTPEGDMSTAATIAQKFSTGKVDLIYSIDTPVSQACVKSTEGTDIPVVFGAVTDPVAAGLVSIREAPRPENVTGVSDMITLDDMNRQLDMILAIVPQAQKLGNIYNAGEVNSVTTAEKLGEVCLSRNIDVVEVTVSTTADVKTAAQSLIDRKVDAVFVGNDNTVIAGLAGLLTVCEENKIPVFPSDIESVERGAVAAFAYDSEGCGKIGGRLAARILQGQKASEIPVEQVERYISVNLSAAQRIGITIPPSILDKAVKIYE